MRPKLLKDITSKEVIVRAKHRADTMSPEDAANPSRTQTQHEPKQQQHKPLSEHKSITDDLEDGERNIWISHP